MRSIITLAALVAATVPLAPAMARTMHGYAVGTTRLYAGPLQDYPSIRYVRRGAVVGVHGCLRDWSWCDVSYGANRGWIAGDSLVVSYRGRRSRVGQDIGIGVISFAFGSYWDSYYRDRDFYRDRPRWQSTYDSRYRPEWGERDRGYGMGQGQPRQQGQDRQQRQNRQGPWQNGHDQGGDNHGRDHNRDHGQPDHGNQDGQPHN